MFANVERLLRAFVTLELTGDLGGNNGDDEPHWLSNVIPARAAGQPKGSTHCLWLEIQSDDKTNWVTITVGDTLQPEIACKLKAALFSYLGQAAATSHTEQNWTGPPTGPALLKLRAVIGFGSHASPSGATSISTAFTLVEPSSGLTIGRALLSFYNDACSKHGPTLQMFEIAKEFRRMSMGTLLFKLVEAWICTQFRHSRRILYEATYVTGGVAFFEEMWYQDGDSVFEELYKTLLPFGKIYHYRPGGAPRQVKDEDQTLLRYMQAVGVPAAQVTAFRRAGGLEGNGPPLVPFTGEDLEDFGEDYTSALPSLIRPYLFISKYTDVIVSKNQANNRPP